MCLEKLSLWDPHTAKHSGYGRRIEMSICQQVWREPCQQPPGLPVDLMMTEGMVQIFFEEPCPTIDLEDLRSLVKYGQSLL